MRLLRLLEPGSWAIELHPYVTVVTGLSQDRRQALVHTAREAALGRMTGLAGLVEAHGVVMDLDQATFDLLELRDVEADIVVRADDLPGIASSDLARQLRSAERRLERVEEPLTRALARVEEAERAVDAARTDVEARAAEVEQAEADVGDLASTEGAPPDDLAGTDPSVADDAGSAPDDLAPPEEAVEDLEDVADVDDSDGADGAAVEVAGDGPGDTAAATTDGAVDDAARDLDDLVDRLRAAVDLASRHVEDIAGPSADAAGAVAEAERALVAAVSAREEAEQAIAAGAETRAAEVARLTTVRAEIAEGIDPAAEEALAAAEDRLADALDRLDAARAAAEELAALAELAPGAGDEGEPDEVDTKDPDGDDLGPDDVGATEAEAGAEVPGGDLDAPDVSGEGPAVAAPVPDAADHELGEDEPIRDGEPAEVAAREIVSILSAAESVIDDEHDPARISGATDLVSGPDPEVTPSPPEVREPPLTVGERLDRLEARAVELRTALDLIEAYDPEPVRAALDVVRAGGVAGLVPSIPAIGLADRIERLSSDLDALADVEPPLAAELDDLARRREAAEADVVRLQQARVPQRSDEDRRALDAAHDEVNDARDAIDESRVRKGKGVARLTAAQAAESELLDRLGFASYLDAVTAWNAPTEDPELAAELRDARAVVAELKAEAAALADREAVEEQRVSLELDLAEAREQGRTLLTDAGVRVGDGDGSLVARLLVHQVPDDRRDAGRELVEALEAVGLSVAGLGFDLDDLIRLASDWLAEQQDAQDQRAALADELREIEATVRGLGHLSSEALVDAEDGAGSDAEGISGVPGLDLGEGQVPDDASGSGTGPTSPHAEPVALVGDVGAPPADEGATSRLERLRRSRQLQDLPMADLPFATDDPLPVAAPVADETASEGDGHGPDGDEPGGDDAAAAGTGRDDVAVEVGVAGGDPAGDAEPGDPAVDVEAQETGSDDDDPDDDGEAGLLAALARLADAEDVAAVEADVAAARDEVAEAQRRVRTHADAVEVVAQLDERLAAHQAADGDRSGAEGADDAVARAEAAVAAARAEHERLESDRSDAEATLVRARAEASAAEQRRDQIAIRALAEEAARREAADAARRAAEEAAELARLAAEAAVADRLQAREAAEDRRVRAAEALEAAHREVDAAEVSLAGARREHDVVRSRHEDAVGEVASLREALAEAADDDIPIEEVEWYLLARMAAQRDVCFGGSVPLVLDATLDDLDDRGLTHLLNRIERMAGAVQLIHVTDDERIVRWATKVGEQRAAIVLPVELGDGPPAPAEVVEPAAETG